MTVGRAAVVCAVSLILGACNATPTVTASTLPSGSPTAPASPATPPTPTPTVPATPTVSPRLATERTSAPPLGAAAGHRWRLVSVADGTADIAAIGDADLRLETTGRITATTGCRTFSGEFVVEGDQLLVTTSSADGTCPSATPVEAQDSLIVGVLRDRFRLRIAEATMTVLNAGISLRYRLADAN
jgi:heat shock protein HslJ